MDESEPLSEYLLSIVEEMSSPETYAEDTGETVEEAKRSLAVVRIMTRYLVGSTEGLSDRATAKFAEAAHRSGVRLEDLFDDHYTRLLLKNIPKMARRTTKLSPIVAEASSEKVRSYLREATRTYIFGFWAASIALSRAALETVLKDRLGSELGLEKLIENGSRYRILDEAHAAVARQIQLKGNDCLHRRNWIPKEADAWAVLCAVRGVLAHVLDPT